MMKIFIAGPTTIHIARQRELVVLSNVMVVFREKLFVGPWRGKHYRECCCCLRLGQYCNVLLSWPLPSGERNNFCFSACHEGDFGQYMNNRRVHEDTDSGDTDHTVRSFWDRFI